MKKHKSGEAHRIPPDDSGEAISSTARVRARRNVIEARETVAIQSGVEEAERGLGFRNEVVVSAAK